MDRALLKRNAKINFKRKWFESAIVALIMSFFVGGSSVSLNTGSSEYSQEYSAGSFEDLFTSIPDEFLYTFVTVFSLAMTVGIIIGIFVFPIFLVGGNRYFLKLRKGVDTGISEIIGNFKDGNYKNIVKISFFRELKIFLWSLLFVIPGIIKTFEYFLIDHILAVRPDIDSKTAFSISKSLMSGYKWEAFVLTLSFLGWQILNGFTFGILGLVYINPYMYATYNEFYCYLRAEGIRKALITPMDLPDYEPPFDNGFGYNPQQAFNGAFQNPYQQPFNAGFQQPDNNPYGYQQQTQESVQTPFWQESNQPVGNVETMPNEEPVSEDEAKEVEFKPMDEE